MKRTLLAIVAMLFLADLIYLGWKWPDWDDLAHGRIKSTSFMDAYQARRKEDKKLPPLRFKLVSANKISPYMFRAVIISEDSQFYQHDGVDWDAVKNALIRNVSSDKRTIGGSTISQQLTKNLFLSSSRSIFRKWHEFVLTKALEAHLTKEQILWLYLNVAEFGRGVYGVEAAAQHYWNISARELSPWQAAALAASLPGPKRNNPDTDSTRFRRYTSRIYKRLMRPRYEP